MHLTTWGVYATISLFLVLSVAWVVFCLLRLDKLVCAFCLNGVYKIAYVASFSFLVGLPLVAGTGAFSLIKVPLVAGTCAFSLIKVPLVVRGAFYLIGVPFFVVCPL